MKRETRTLVSQPQPKNATNTNTNTLGHLGISPACANKQFVFAVSVTARMNKTSGEFRSEQGQITNAIFGTVSDTARCGMRMTLGQERQAVLFWPKLNGICWQAAAFPYWTLLSIWLFVRFRGFVGDTQLIWPMNRVFWYSKRICPLNGRLS